MRIYFSKCENAYPFRLPHAIALCAYIRSSLMRTMRIRTHDKVASLIRIQGDWAENTRRDAVQNVEAGGEW